tara:strand:+ start:17 stop:1093 length:1077 start_codon:yes stop_codon:yes gene_type:complete
MMKNSYLFIIFFIYCLNVHANDGAFKASGNQLIPITETDIKVQKEILTLKKIKEGFIEVTVYYEFFNPKKEKTLTVGFEAFSPSGDVNGAPKYGEHPYMNDFTVELNNKILTYNIAYVKDSLYQQNGKVNSIVLDEFTGSKSGNNVAFFYVYHFDAKFKKGINIIKHTYRYAISGGICYNYDFSYILTAANRWGNNQIDDFTLIIDNGVFQSFDITKTFFNNNSDWLVNGIGKKINAQNENGLATTRFHIQKGNIIFQKKNFKPLGELFVSSMYCGMPVSYYNTPFDFQSNRPPEHPKNDFERKLLKNLPFARRGYVFSNNQLQEYYEKLDWYIPNKNYRANVESLYEEEKKWLEKYK